MKRHTFVSLLDQIAWLQARNHRAYLSHRKKRLYELVKEQ